MKGKILGILICMLFIASMAIPISAINKESKPLSNSADVPVWEVGDSWTYEADYYEAGENETLIFTLNGEIEYTVTDDSGDYYILEGTGRPLGIIQYGNIGMRTSMFSKAVFEMQIRKSDFGIEHSYYYIKGLCWFTLGGIPLPIPIQVFGEKYTEFDPITSIIPFPLFDGKTGTIDSIEFNEHGGTWLFWQLIELSNYETSWGSGDLPYTCTEEQITVPAGEFDVYRIEAENVYEDHYNSYYCEEVGNSVKQSTLIYNQLEEVYLDFSLELVSTTYEP